MDNFLKQSWAGLRILLALTVLAASFYLVYVLEILKVREIIGYMDITAVPRTPGYVRGLASNRELPIVRKIAGARGCRHEEEGEERNAGHGNGPSSSSTSMRPSNRFAW